MYNLKSFGGTFKGAAGECMFKLAKKYAFLTRYTNRDRYLEFASQHLNLDQIAFLRKHWFSLDAIEILFGEEPVATIFEIKTENFKTHKHPRWKPKTTAATVSIHSMGKALGLKSKLAKVTLYDDWHYGVEILDFKQSLFSIDKKKKYDVGYVPRGA